MGKYTKQLMETQHEGVMDKIFHPTDCCFYCGKPLDGDEWIYWSGADENSTQIWLHPACVPEFTAALSKWH
jgi:hypothetical protein